MSYINRFYQGFWLSISSFLLIWKEKIPFLHFLIIETTGLRLYAAMSKISKTSGGSHILMKAAALWLIITILTFFNACIVYLTMQHIKGNMPTCGDAFQACLAKRKPLIIWTLLSATITTTTCMLLERAITMPLICYIILAVLVILWHLVTTFVLPMIMFERKTIVQTIIASHALFHEQWVEIVAGGSSFAVIILLSLLATIIPSPLAVAFLMSTLSTTIAIFQTKLYYNHEKNTLQELEELQRESLFE
ncbi:MAG TPA: DUF6159 family protein [Candidatus Babeliales bacterium]|nr:DUF6159 family protein [Candidatus Babeliales bacterium]